MRSAGSVVIAQMPDMRRGIARRTVRDIISDKLTGLIASGVLQIGDELPGERELAAALAVSRETIRGVIQSLAARGVVEVSQGSRTRIASTDVGPVKVGISLQSTINSYDIDAVHQARLLVERTVVAEAAEFIDDETLQALQCSLDAQREALDDPIRFLINDREFHTTIYQAAPNKLLADFVTDLYTYMLEHRRRAVARVGAIRESYDDHVAILEALGARDPQATVVAFDRHLQRIYSTTLSVLNDLDSIGGGDPTRARKVGADEE
jgi:DNA-binding FadR family transcriptional regulator